MISIRIDSAKKIFKEEDENLLLEKMVAIEPEGVKIYKYINRFSNKEKYTDYMKIFSKEEEEIFLSNPDYIKPILVYEKKDKDIVDEKKKEKFLDKRFEDQFKPPSDAIKVKLKVADSDTQRMMDKMVPPSSEVNDKSEEEITHELVNMVPDEEKDKDYDLILMGPSKDIMEKKDVLCKNISKKFSISVKKAEELVNKAPIIVKSNVKRKDIPRYYKMLQDLGAKVRVRISPSSS
ncbi:MAG: hypothetical protein JRI44_12530 [Deltaproteobacteria bacterium]|nr:hypothetical protein [Deltaproteobacteria bacterium]